MKTATKTKMKKEEFEFCKVCRINHDNGRRHNYFPSHTKALSSLFSRFHKKVADVRSFLKNPVLLRPEHASRHRLWCVFCDSDIDEVGSNISSNNAIRHLASEYHLKNLKHFLWKYGGGMERMDSFRILEEDLAMWVKRCEALKKEAASSTEGARGLLDNVPNDIQPNCGITNNFENSSFQFVESGSISHDVMPLQYSTKEDCEVNRSEAFQVANAGLHFSAVASSLRLAVQYESNAGKCENIAAYGGSQCPNSSTQRTSLANGHANNNWAYINKVKASGSSSSMDPGFQNLSRLPAWDVEESEGNVHSGVPPPWLDATEGVNINSVFSSSMTFRKSSKMNPKRVGAAWAEKRKRELEMEKRGEIATNGSDANWLPNFGRVWQSGTRKESRKEFVKEKYKLPKEETPLEGLAKIQPYISKRMKRDPIGGSSEGHVESARSSSRMMAAGSNGRSTNISKASTALTSHLIYS
ncbi:hypothetical protein Dimus_023700 [Dionaea muscipula]